MAKTKLTRSQRKTLVYRTVRNAFYDTTLANLVSNNGWSNERIERELGITVPNKLPELKPLTEKSRKRGARRLDHTIYGLEIGLEPAVVRRVWDYKKGKIDSTKEYHDGLKAYSHRATRYKQWKKWSRKDGLNFPPELRARAVQYNRDANYDDQTSYGYMLVFYEHVDGKTKEEILATEFYVDKFSAAGAKYYVDKKVEAVEH